MNLLKPYGTCIRFGIEHIYRNDPDELERIAKSTDFQDIRQRERPDLIFITHDLRIYFIECKETTYNKYKWSHSLQVPAIQFAMFREFYNKQYPVIYFMYSTKHNEWHAFLLDDAMKALDHIKHVYGNDTSIPDQLLPALRNQDSDPQSGSRQDMLAFSKKLRELNDWLKKI